MHAVSEDQQRTTATILDEYCRYYSDFSKILGIYTKNVYPQFSFEFEQLLDASYNVWHRLSDEDKISLATFLEEMSRETSHIESTSSKTKALNGLMTSDPKYSNSKFGKKHTLSSKPLALNTSSYITPIPKASAALIQKRASITPFHIYLKDERKKFMSNHSKMSMGDINKRLSKRWQKMSNRMRYKYEYRSYLAKKRLYKKQGQSMQLKKPSFIKRTSSKSVQMKSRKQPATNSSRSNLPIRNR